MSAPMGQGDPAAVERQRLMYAERARARGLEIVHGSFQEQWGNGVCVLGAYDRTAKKGEALSLPAYTPEDDAAFVAAWDAIEAGFDRSMRRGLPIEWYAVGRRLRVALNPREARS